MADPDTLEQALNDAFPAELQLCRSINDQVTIEIDVADAITVFTALRDDPRWAFDQLLDVCGVDYAAYGADEWDTTAPTATGYSRGVDPKATGRSAKMVSRHGHESAPKRFAAVYHLLSLPLNHRLRVRIYAPDDELPIVPSVIQLWSSADWYEREAFDLFGIIFEGHPDLRRILTDYGFVGHPFRKDFPLIGNVEMRYDPDRGRVIYEPVSIEDRVLVPKVIRKDYRHNERTEQEKSTDA